MRRAATSIENNQESFVQKIVVCGMEQYINEWDVGHVN